MPEDYSISVSLTQSEIARYNFYHILWLIWLDVVGFVILLAGVYFSIVAPDPDTRRTLGILVMWGALFLAVGLSQPFILFLQIFILKGPAVEKQMAPRAYLFDDEGIHVHSGEKTAMTHWSKVARLKDIGSIFLIYTSPKLAYVIPKRLFETKEQGKRFLEYLRGKLKAK